MICKNLMRLLSGQRIGKYYQLIFSRLGFQHGTFDSLMSLCSPEAIVLLLGPSTPLSPVMFDYGVDILAGSIVTNIEAVFRAVSQGANFRQVKAAGVRLLTVARPGF